MAAVVAMGYTSTENNINWVEIVIQYCQCWFSAWDNSVQIYYTVLFCGPSPRTHTEISHVYLEWQTHRGLTQRQMRLDGWWKLQGLVGPPPDHRCCPTGRHESICCYLSELLVENRKWWVFLTLSSKLHFVVGFLTGCRKRQTDLLNKLKWDWYGKIYSVH